MIKPNLYQTIQMDNSITKIIEYHVISLDFDDGVVEYVGFVGTGLKQQ